MSTMLGSSSVGFGAGRSQPCRAQCGTSGRSLQKSRCPHSTRRSVLVRASSNSTMFTDPWPLAPWRIERAVAACSREFIEADEWKESKHYLLSDGGAAVVAGESMDEITLLGVHCPNCIEKFVAGFLVTAQPERIAALTSVIPEKYILQRAAELPAYKRAETFRIFTNPVFALAAVGISLVAAWWHNWSKRLAIAEKQESQELQAVLKDKMHADNMKLVIVLSVAVCVAVSWHTSVAPTLMAVGKQMSSGSGG